MIAIKGNDELAVNKSHATGLEGSSSISNNEESWVHPANCCNKRVLLGCLDGGCSSVVISREEPRPRTHTRRPALVCAKGSLLCAPTTTAVSSKKEKSIRNINNNKTPTHF